MTVAVVNSWDNILISKDIDIDPEKTKIKDFHATMWWMYCDNGSWRLQRLPHFDEGEIIILTNVMAVERFGEENNEVYNTEPKLKVSFTSKPRKWMFKS